MNKGALQATGEYICFVNGGDFLYENALKNAEKIFSETKNKLFFSVADIDYIDQDNNVVGSKICRSDNEIIKRRFIEMPTNHLGMFVPLKALKDENFFDLRFKYRADYFFVLNLIEKGYKPINLKKIGGFRLGGISGGYGTFLENYKIVKTVSGNFIIAAYSCILGTTKLFLQKNLPTIYKLIAKIYYKFNKSLIREYINLNEEIKILHIVDSDTGGGAEKIASILQKKFKK